MNKKSKETLLSLLKDLSINNTNQNNDDLSKIDAGSLCILLFETISGLSFDKKEAMDHWESIQIHKQSLTEKMNRDPGFLVTTFDYFTNIKKLYKTPKIIELASYNDLLKSTKEDIKTGLYNCRYFKNILKNEINRAKRNNYSISVLFLDVDNFKFFNDKYGHLSGDKFLIFIADILKNTLRREDIAARFGGDEFIILLPHTDKSNAKIVTERIFNIFNKTPFFININKDTKYYCSLSIGYATFPVDGDNIDILLKNADMALYFAKKSGKNHAIGFNGIDYNNAEDIIYKCNNREININVRETNSKYRAYLKNISKSQLLLDIPYTIQLLQGTYLTGNIDSNEDTHFEFSGKIINTKKHKIGVLATIQFENTLTDIETILKVINKNKDIKNN